MPYDFAAESFHTKKLCSRLSSRKSHFFTEMKKSRLRPPLGVRAMYAVHRRLIGKLVGDFLLVIIELFSLGALVLSQYTRLTDRRTDRQMDRQTESRQQYRAYASQSHGKNRRSGCDLMKRLTTSIYCSVVQRQLEGV